MTTPATKTPPTPLHFNVAHDLNDAEGMWTGVRAEYATPEFRQRLALAVNEHEALVALVARMTGIPSRDCPWGCDIGHDKDCPATRAYAVLARIEKAGK